LCCVGLFCSPLSSSCVSAPTLFGVLVSVLVVRYVARGYKFRSCS
jgi:hypothetical protein